MGEHITSIFDFIFLIFVFISFILGIVRGAVREIINIIGILMAFVVSGAFYYQIFILTGIQFTVSPEFAQIIWYILLFTSTWLLFKIINHFINKLISKSKSMNFYNRVLGALVGAGKGLIICALLSFIIVSIPIPKLNLPPALDQHINESYSLKWAKNNIWILDKIRELGFIQNSTSFIAKMGCDTIVKKMLPSQDEKIQQKAFEILLPIISDPSILNRLNESPTARRVGKKFLPKIEEYFGESSILRDMETNGVDILGITKLLKSKEMEAFLADPKVRNMILNVNLPKIKRELNIKD